MKLGVLALQGCVAPHQKHIEALGAHYCEIRTKKDLSTIHGLILPGGESTTQLKLIQSLDLENSLLEIAKKIPIWGICAGAILMAEKVTHPTQKSLNLLPIEIERNSYGRQLDSFFTKIRDYSVCFIRAPKIVSYSSTVEVLAEWNQSPVWVKQGSHMVSSFHPELTSTTPSPMHQLFFDLCSKA